MQRYCAKDSGAVLFCGSRIFLHPEAGRGAKSVFPICKAIVDTLFYLERNLRYGRFYGKGAYGYEKFSARLYIPVCSYREL